MGPLKFKIFNHSHYTLEIFKIGKYEKKIKCDKIWGYLNEGIPLKQGRENLNFLTAYAKHIKFSE